MNIDDILKNIPDKRIEKNTTSLKMKKDLIKFFGDKYLNKKCFEIGTNKGYTTRVLSFLFDKVKTVDIDTNLIDFSKFLNKDRNNIEHTNMDIYNTNIVESNDWWDGEAKNEKFDVFFIDCVHDEEHVTKDIQTSIAQGTDDVIMIFDDYGLPEEYPSVKIAVDKALSDGTLKFIKHVGEPAGHEPRRGRKLVDWEGIICQKA